jgi:hypothetical protein
MQLILSGSLDVPNVMDDSYLVQEYDYAVIRLATFQSTPRADPRLLFGSVALLTPSRSNDKAMKGVESRNLRVGGARVHFRRIVMKANEAIHWYRSAGIDTLTTPVPSNPQAFEKKLDGKPLLCSGFEDNPVWPELGIPFTDNLFSGLSGAEDPAPFRGDRASRIHRRFGNDSGFDALLGDPDSVRFLHRRIHFDIAEYPEYLGSLVLIAPDPIIERIENYLVPATANSPEYACIRLVPRLGKNLNDLRITFFERSANVLSTFDVRDIPEDGLVLQKRSSEVANSGFLITHSRHKLLAYQPLSNYLRRMNFQMDVVSATTTVGVPLRDSLDSPIKNIISNRSESMQPATWGKEITSSFSRVGNANDRRRQRADAERFEQRWFSDREREVAVEYIHSRIERANKRVIMADPYLGALQIAQFVPKVSRTHVRVTLLTSAAAFDDTGTPAKSAIVPSMTLKDYEELKRVTKQKNSEKKLAKFKLVLEKIRGLRQGNVEALIVPGKSSKLHDRFLVVDDDVWFIGHSFSSIGDKPFLILKVPAPKEVINNLLALISSAKSFERYSQDWLRRSNRSSLMDGNVEKN